MTCGSGRNGALGALAQLQHPVSESLRSFGRWAGSAPSGFVLDNVSDFIRNAVRLGLRMGFLILAFPSVVGSFSKTRSFPGVFRAELGDKWKRNNLAPPRWLWSPEPLLPHPGRALWCPSSHLDLYRIPGIPWWSSPLPAVGYSHGNCIFVFDVDGKRGIFFSP